LPEDDLVGAPAPPTANDAPSAVLDTPDNKSAGDAVADGSSNNPGAVFDGD
jgi:hypothetical protein